MVFQLKHDSIVYMIVYESTAGGSVVIIGIVGVVIVVPATEGPVTGVVLQLSIVAGASGGVARIVEWGVSEFAL